MIESIGADRKVLVHRLAGIYLAITILALRIDRDWLDAIRSKNADKIHLFG